jgi:hypothetical protein
LWLESELTGELKFARFCRRSDQAKLGIANGVVNGCIPSRSGDQQATHIAAVLVMVEGVECIRLECKS